MNIRDSELVAGLLLKKGYKLTDQEKEADIVLVNTCSVRKHAEDRVWSEIGKLKKRKICTGKPFIGLIGCMAQAWQQAVFDKAPLVDLVVGPNNISAIPGLLEDLEAGFGRAIAVGKEQRDAFVYNTEYISDKSHSNVNIMEGCNNFCSYCIVPYVRGRERSRDADEIIKEIKSLVKKGVKEITLLGQNVNSYNSVAVMTNDKLQMTNNVGEGLASSRKKITFTDLLKMVNDIEGLEKFDFVTSHPKDANIALFKKMAELDKCRKFLHLPVQSGSDRMLKKMNRGYTVAHYKKLAKAAKEIIPGLRLGTDVMVGFPTESEKDFEDTYQLMREIQFDAAYLFKYSPRPHTKAADLDDDISEEVKRARHQILLDYQRKLHKKKKSAE
ncbi:MAG: tRNA (N6-isopentenyl adenosine(37)-C2)-methylthiotransferase MiaB [Candidatus Omnitrophica bacterium]|nr:tRNA (N6-isopentenyl adenosine(37)-C2)-methylthiotransferase MiaB [Candidatus Omnitrophota bacterium]